MQLVGMYKHICREMSDQILKPFLVCFVSTHRRDGIESSKAVLEGVHGGSKNTVVGVDSTNIDFVDVMGSKSLEQPRLDKAGVTVLGDENERFNFWS